MWNSIVSVDWGGEGMVLLGKESMERTLTHFLN